MQVVGASISRIFGCEGPIPVFMRCRRAMSDIVGEAVVDVCRCDVLLSRLGSGSERFNPCLRVSSGVSTLAFAPLQCRCVTWAFFVASSRGSGKAMLPFLAAVGGAYAVNFLGDIVSNT